MRLILALCFCAVTLIADDAIVFRGVPTVRVFSDPDKDDRQKMEGDVANKNECVIMRRGKKYYWASRQNAPMTRTDVPPFTYFFHNSGAGYVKVYTGERGPATASADYVEHINRGFETVTYWGRVTLTQ